MKRLTLLAVTALFSLFLVACGDNAEKKVENKADVEMNQPQTTQPDQAQPDQVKPDETKQDQSKLDDANKDVNNELSAAAISSANEQVAQVAKDGSDNVTTLASKAASESLPQSA